MIIARAILKKLTILAILAKSGDFDGYLRITFSGFNIFKKRFLIHNVLFKTNSGRCIKPWFERKKNFTPRGEPSPFLWNSNLTYCWKNSLRTLLKVSIVLYLWIEWVKIARQKILGKKENIFKKGGGGGDEVVYMFKICVIKNTSLSHF